MTHPHSPARSSLDGGTCQPVDAHVSGLAFYSPITGASAAGRLPVASAQGVKTIPHTVRSCLSLLELPPAAVGGSFPENSVAQSEVLPLQP